MPKAPYRNDGRILFEERQYFRQAWLWLLLLLAAVPVGLLVASQYAGKLADDASGWLVVALSFVISIGLLALFYVTHLHTVVTEKGIYTRVWPLMLRYERILQAQCREVAIRRYNPVLEYGGYGIRFGRRGKAYNVTGRYGLTVYFTKNRELLIGTQKPDELLNACTASGFPTAKTATI
jgi:hypothetical protein